jgi:hypothetical protein
LRLAEEEKCFFDSMATLMQKSWRGFYCRRMNQDFYARKHYIGQVSQQGLELSKTIERDLAAASKAASRVRTLTIMMMMMMMMMMMTISPNVALDHTQVREDAAGVEFGAITVHTHTHTHIHTHTHTHTHTPL